MNLKKRSPRIEQAIRDACEFQNITRLDLLSLSQARSTTEARGHLCRLFREWGLSFHEIARALNLHHTSVIYHCQKAEQPAAPPVETPDPDGCLICDTTRAQAYEQSMGMLCINSEDLLHHFIVSTVMSETPEEETTPGRRILTI